MDRILSPHQKSLLPHLIVEILRSRGQTIVDLGGKMDRGDPRQRGHAGLAVWHAKGGIDDQVAKTLRLPPSLWGPRMVTNNLPIHTRRALAKLAKQGTVAVWNPNKASLFRLADFGRQPAPADLPVPSAPIRADLDMGALFMTIVSKSSKDNTYKFVLGKILLDYCKNNSPESVERSIPYDYLAGEFLKYYWHQRYRFKMRQHTHHNNGPVATQILENVFGEDPPLRFGDLDQGELKRARQMILERVFASARSYRGNVVHRFQRIGRGDSMEQKNDIYDYDDVRKTITLKPDAHAFLRQNYDWLERALVAEWASYLERANPGLPLIAAKLSSIDSDPKPTGKSKAALLRTMKSPYCFYCENGLDANHACMNHFLPWRYLFDDHAWNLVIACNVCDGVKKDSLAPSKFTDLLVERNAQYVESMDAMRKSLLQLSPSGEWESAIRGHYQMCAGYGFGEWIPR